MKSLLEEASRMLKTMPQSGGDSTSDEGDARIRSLQRQLDELKGSQGHLRVLRLARVKPCEQELGLLDSGATHALRPRFEGEPVGQYEKVKINLAGGKQLNMMMSPGKVIVGDRGVEPIVPLGQIVQRLGCTLQWTEDHMTIIHPQWGQIPTIIKDGCPMVTVELALKLIEALEADHIGGLMKISGGTDPMFDWIERLSKEHPAFQGVPEEIRKKLVVRPKDEHISGNRRRRKLWKREGGVVLYLYLGKDEGFTMSRSVRDQGGDRRKVIQVDIQNGAKWDMVNGGLYGELLDKAVKGQLDAVVASPNCRTRSRLRHREIPGVDLPGPSRSWNGEEWGKRDMNEKEKEKCFEDDVMMLRAWMIFIVAQECRKAEMHRKKVGLVLEHPSAPEDLPENVSIWRTPQWKALARAYQLHEVQVDQAALGGESKPTTLGCNYNLNFPDLPRRPYQPRQWRGKTRDQLVQESKRLARWTPLLTNSISEAILRAQGVNIKIHIEKTAWCANRLQHVESHITVKNCHPELESFHWIWVDRWSLALTFFV